MRNGAEISRKHEYQERPGDGGVESSKAREMRKLTWIMSAKEGCVGGEADLDAFLVEAGFLLVDMAVSGDEGGREDEKGGGSDEEMWWQERG